MLKLISNFLLFSILLSLPLFAQSPQKHKGKFIEKKNEFWDKIEYENKKFAKGKKKIFILDFKGMDLPKSKDEFKSVWHNDPVAQGNSGMCWCFSTTSFMNPKFTGRPGAK